MAEKQDDDIQEDRFGFKHMTTTQEAIISFALFIMGGILIAANLVPLMGHTDLSPAYLGLVMVTAGYFFAVESIRELEEKDHFLSRKLRKKD